MAINLRFLLRRRRAGVDEPPSDHLAAEMAVAESGHSFYYGYGLDVDGVSAASSHLLFRSDGTRLWHGIVGAADGSTAFVGDGAGLTGTVAAEVAWGNVTGKPATFTPSAHNQAWSTITGTPTTLSGYGITDAATSAQGAKADTAVQPGDDVSDLAETSTAKIMTGAERTKLAGVETGATANDTDANLLARGNHTGTQAASTITGLATVATSGAYSDLTGLPSLFDGAYSSLTGVPSTFTPASHTHAAIDVTSGTFANARISQASVTQHEAALTITESQISDLGAYITDYTVTEGDVTAHEAALTITESQISDLGAYLTSVAWGDVTGKPATFTPSSHTHTVSEITDFSPADYLAKTGGTLSATLNIDANAPILEFNELDQAADNRKWRFTGFGGNLLVQAREDDGTTVLSTYTFLRSGAANGSNDVLRKSDGDTLYATDAQGALADSATQPGDLATVATSGSYDDLTGTPAAFAFCQYRNTDTSTNINTASATVIPFGGTTDASDADFTINGSNNRITCNFNGVVNVQAHISQSGSSGSVLRSSVAIYIGKNGTQASGRGLTGYIRDANDHLESSAHITATMSVSDGDYIEIFGIAEGNTSPTVTQLSGASQVTVERRS